MSRVLNPSNGADWCIHKLICKENVNWILLAVIALCTFRKKKCVYARVLVLACYFLCWRSNLDPTDRKLFALLCTKFPSRPQSFLSENDSEHARRVVITCDITTLISSLVIVKSLWVERVNNGEECEMRGGACVVVWMRPTVVSGWSSLLLPKFMHCNFACGSIGLDNQRPSFFLLQICFWTVLKRNWQYPNCNNCYFVDWPWCAVFDKNQSWRKISSQNVTFNQSRSFWLWC